MFFDDQLDDLLLTIKKVNEYNKTITNLVVIIKESKQFLYSKREELQGEIYEYTNDKSKNENNVIFIQEHLDFYSDQLSKVNKILDFINKVN